MSLKNNIWELIEKEIPNASDNIGWGSMDSLCEDIIELIKEDSTTVQIPKDEYKQLKKDSYTLWNCVDQ